MLNSESLELLQFYADIGVDEAMGDEAADRTRLPAPAALAEKPATVLPMMAAARAEEAPAAAVNTEEAAEAAQKATTRAELKAALEGFRGLTLKRGGGNMVFADGAESGKVMVIGDAPAAEDERAGVPFAGEAGQMLDRMLAAIGLSRAENVYLTALVNWRTPGGRAATADEIALSLPFARKHIELTAPAAIILVGGAAAQILLETKEPLARLRGKWLDYDGIPAIALYHPAYLMQNPAQKKPAWYDLQMFQAKLKDLGVL